MLWDILYIFGGFLGIFGKGYFFLKGLVKLRGIGNIEDLMKVGNWNLKLKISRWAPKQFHTNLQCLCGCQLSGGVSRHFFLHFNPFLKLLLVSLQFTLSPTIIS